MPCNTHACQAAPETSTLSHAGLLHALPKTQQCDCASTCRDHINSPARTWAQHIDDTDTDSASMAHLTPLTFIPDEVANPTFVLLLQNRALTLSLEREKQKVAKLQQALASGVAGAAGGAAFDSKVRSWPGQQYPAVPSTHAVETIA